MVEEMYLDEVKEAEAEADMDMDMDGTSVDQSKSNTENSKSGITASNLEVDEGGTTPAVGIANSGTTTIMAATATTAISTKQTDMNQKGHPDEAGSEEKHLDVATDPNNISVFHGHIGPNTNTVHANANVNVHGHVHVHVLCKSLCVGVGRKRKQRRNVIGAQIFWICFVIEFQYKPLTNFNIYFLYRRALES